MKYIWWSSDTSVRFFPHQTFDSSRVCTNALLQIHSSDFKNLMLYYDDLANMKTHHWGFSLFSFRAFEIKKEKKYMMGFHIPKMWQILMLSFIRSLQSSIILLFLKSDTTYTVHTKFLKILFSTLLYFEKIKFFQRLEMNFLSSSCKKKKKKNLFVIYTNSNSIIILQTI